MAGSKRSAPESTDSTRTTRSKKVKTDESSSPSSKAKGGKRGPKAIPTSAFKAKAMPLHVNITHTPPPITDENEVSTAAADPGFIGTSTLVATEFKTGSYGWKGSKRVTIELPNHDGGETEKVQVMISINATVMGSKNADDGKETSGPVETTDTVEDQDAAADDADAEKPEDDE
jgi:hypothetical protein